jgi:REP element-mobilizing transposase RayT
MFHLVARAVHGTVLFRDHVEAAELWAAITRAVGGLVALCLMPDHVHLITERDASAALGHAMQGFAQWRNHHRREEGSVWQRQPPAEDLADEQKVRRAVRYVHLNPCRAGLVSDPLAWAWSTHRDAVGLVARPVIERAHDPARFHRYVSADPHVAVEGTELPAFQLGKVAWADVVEAVGAVSRVTQEALLVRGRPRTLAARTAWACDLREATVIARGLNMSERSVRRVVAGVRDRAARQRDADLAACVRVIGDPRFASLPTFDLRGTPEWRAWSRRKREPR